MSSEKNKNKLLLYHREKIKTFLDRDEDKRLALRIIQHCNLPLERIYEPSEFILNEYILTIKLKDFLDMLNDIKLPYSDSLLGIIRETWESFKRDLMKQIKQTFGTINRNFFDKNNKEYFDFKRIYIPLDIVNKKKVNNISNNNLGTEFLNIILKEKERILITGETGIGKTFNFMNILNSWASGETKLSEFAILYLQLDQTTENFKFEEELYKQNFQNSQIVTKDLFDYYISSDCDDKQRKFVICIDGINGNRTEIKLITQLLSRKDYFKNFPIIVWCRSTEAYLLTEIFDFIFEIQGFNEINRNLFLESFECSKVKLKMLDKFLLINTEFYSFFQNPSFCCFALQCWNTENTLNLLKCLDILERFIKNIIQKLSTKHKLSDILGMIFQNGIEFSFEKILSNNQLNQFFHILKTSKYGKTMKNLLFAKFIENVILTENSEELKNLSEVFEKKKEIFLLRKSFLYLREINEKAFSLLSTKHKKIKEILVNSNEPINSFMDMKLNQNSLDTIKLRNNCISPFYWDLIIELFYENVTEIEFKNICLEMKNFITSLPINKKKSLKVFSIDSCKNICNSITDLIQIFDLFENLKIFSIKNFNIYLDKEFVYLESNNLTSFTISNCNLTEMIENNSFTFKLPNLLNFEFLRMSMKGKVRFLNFLENFTTQFFLVTGWKNLLDCLYDAKSSLRSADFSSTNVIPQIGKYLFYDWWPRFDVLEVISCTNDSLMKEDNSCTAFSLKTAFKNIKNISNLRMIDLKMMLDVNDFLLIFDKFPSLNILELSGNYLTENENCNFINGLCQLQFLKSLKLPIINFIEKINYQSISVWKSEQLETVYFNENSVKNFMIQNLLVIIMENCKFLGELSLENTYVNQDIVKEYITQKNCRLKTLTLNGNKIEESIMKILFKKMSNLNLRNCCICSFSSIEKKCNIISLNLSSNNLKTGFKNIFKSLNLDLIEKIHFQNCQLDNLFIDYLIKLWRELKNLKFLDISENYFLHSCIHVFLQNLHSKVNPLEELYINNCKIPLQSLSLSNKTIEMNLRRLKILNSKYILRKNDLSEFFNDK